MGREFEEGTSEIPEPMELYNTHTRTHTKLKKEKKLCDVYFLIVHHLPYNEILFSASKEFHYKEDDVQVGNTLGTRRK